MHYLRIRNVGANSCIYSLHCMMVLIREKRFFVSYLPCSLQGKCTRAFSLQIDSSYTLETVKLFIVFLQIADGVKIDLTLTRSVLRGVPGLSPRLTTARLTRGWRGEEPSVWLIPIEVSEMDSRGQGRGGLLYTM